MKRRYDYRREATVRLPSWPMWMYWSAFGFIVLFLITGNPLIALVGAIFWPVILMMALVGGIFAWTLGIVLLFLVIAGIVWLIGD